MHCAVVGNGTLANRRVIGRLVANPVANMVMFGTDDTPCRVFDYYDRVANNYRIMHGCEMV